MAPHLGRIKINHPPSSPHMFRDFVLHCMVNEGRCLLAGPLSRSASFALSNYSHAITSSPHIKAAMGDLSVCPKKADALSWCSNSLSGKAVFRCGALHLR